MKIFNKQKNNKGSRFINSYSNCLKRNPEYSRGHAKGQAGFTLIETMVAVFILTMAISSLLNINASSIFSARYAKNEITANYLLQEAIDSIRNDRDTTVFYAGDTNVAWATFKTKYANCMGSFSGASAGCYFEPASLPLTITLCASATGFGVLPCPRLNYDDNASNNDFYTYKTGVGIIPSNFKRQVLMQVNGTNGGNEIDVKATVEWLNGNLVRSRSLQISLLKWK